MGQIATVTTFRNYVNSRFASHPGWTNFTWSGTQPINLYWLSRAAIAIYEKIHNPLPGCALTLSSRIRGVGVTNQVVVDVDLCVRLVDYLHGNFRRQCEGNCGTAPCTNSSGWQNCSACDCDCADPNFTPGYCTYCCYGGGYGNCHIECDGGNANCTLYRIAPCCRTLAASNCYNLTHCNPYGNCLQRANCNCVCSGAPCSPECTPSVCDPWHCSPTSSNCTSQCDCACVCQECPCDTCSITCQFVQGQGVPLPPGTEVISKSQNCCGESTGHGSYDWISTCP